MLGVLLASARRDQRRPSVHDFMDLLRGAVGIRLRRFPKAIREDWSDAFAVVSLLAPILLCLGLSVPAAGLLVRAALNDYGTTTLVLLGGAVLAWPAVIVAAFVGRRRLAVTGAWVLGVLGLYVSGGGQMLEWAGLGLLAAVSITWSPGPARALEVLGRGRLIAYAAGVLLLGAPHASVFATAGGIRMPGWVNGPTATATALGLLLVGSVALRTDTPTARRTSILLALPLAAIALSLFQAGFWEITPQGTETMISATLPVVAFLCFLFLHLWAQRGESGSPRGRIEQAG